MAIQYKVDLSAFGRLSDRCNEIKGRTRNLRPVLKGRAQALSTVIDKSFEQSESPLGLPFAPLAESTVDQRRQQSPRPLERTGEYRKSHTTRAKGNRIVFGVSGNAAERAPTHVLGVLPDVPRRSTLPINARGKVSFASGRAKKWLLRAEDRIINYVLHGKLK